MSQLKKNKSAALRFANKVRKALGKKPISRFPLGIPEDPCKCSLALAIEDPQARVVEGILEFDENLTKNYVVGKALDYDVNLDKQSSGLELEISVSKFVQDFDKGKYPELVNIVELVREYHN
jgi:hypothetical protein